MAPSSISAGTPESNQKDFKVKAEKLYLLREPFLRRSPERTPPLFSGGMVAGCGIRSRPRGGGVWGGIRAGFGFIF